MNKFNLLRLKRYGVIAEISSTQGGSPVLKINLPAAGGDLHRQLGFGGPPHFFESDRFSAATSHISDADKQRFVEVDDSCAVAAEVLDALARHGKKLAAAANNNKLSGDGKHEIAMEAATEALTTMGGQYAALERIGERLAREHKDLYAVPAADAAATMVDVETRTLFRQLPIADQMQLVVSVSAPNMRQLLMALLRTPLPLDPQHSTLVVNAWTEAVCESKGEQAATLKIAEENYDWANRLTKHLAGIVSNPNLSGTFGAIDRFAAYKILRPTGGAAVLNFTRDEILYFERRLAQAAA